MVIWSHGGSTLSAFSSSTTDIQHVPNVDCDMCRRRYINSPNAPSNRPGVAQRGLSVAIFSFDLLEVLQNAVHVIRRISGRELFRSSLKVPRSVLRVTDFSYRLDKFLETLLKAIVVAAIMVNNEAAMHLKQ
jgi:hypothetical protein